MRDDVCTDCTYQAQSDDGYIAWRKGTGGNVELLHIHSLRPGGGTALLTYMVRQLAEDPPYCTVFGFTRSSNAQAHKFYAKHGFSLSEVRGVYEEGSAVVFSAQFNDLRRRLL